MILSPLYSQIGDSKLELPKGYPVKEIRNVPTEVNGLSTDNNSNICSTFNLTSSEVFDYFANAKRISFGLYDYRFETGCYAMGSIVFNNGDQGKWTIDRNRLGTLLLSDGRWAYFYGFSAHSKAFPVKGDPNFFKIELDSITRTKKINYIQRIKSITFKSNFKWDMSEQQRSGGCLFTLSVRNVGYFFSHAKIITNEERLNIVYGKTQQRQLVPTKGCQIEGDVEFTNGEKGAWVIYDNGIGILEIDHLTLYLYSNTAIAKALRKP